ncbi:unnamed protein product [Clonostachys rosea]|uniref:Uncharacterized protein n=1 Tax=Bionectria ochroleuca TaxID=29856 RepID=A0ABY6UYA9_BIOOC|nr:unnamed protein product [Clonostachys rosea]
MADQSDSHKERAYIAASRRHDRGIEARLESARQASKIHKKRTGRALRISEEIVLGDAAYEEEEAPRRRQLSGSPLMQQNIQWQGDPFAAAFSPGSPQTQMFTEKEWRENMVNQAFSQAFPQLDARLSQRWPAQYFAPREHGQAGQFRSPSIASSNLSSQSALSGQFVDAPNSETSSPLLPTGTPFPGHYTQEGVDGPN